jgi:hypothetical protein
MAILGNMPIICLEIVYRYLQWQPSNASAKQVMKPSSAPINQY